MTERGAPAESAMYFQHASDIWADFPALVPGVLFVDGITTTVSVDASVAAHAAVATARLAAAAEGQWPEIQAWRQAFRRMGLEPTQYRCAAESLLRRFRKDRALPRIHPLVDLCNAVSAAFAIPVAVFDAARIAGHLEVRRAAGDETYTAFSGETERPDVREVIFADGERRAHARRWTNRQSGHSAVREVTTSVLIVAEALHASAAADVARLTTVLADEIGRSWAVSPKAALLTPSSRRFLI
jgi:DNA/RNA-binding domain of Phe-tRNA-synthetase-like protein